MSIENPSFDEQIEPAEKIGQMLDRETHGDTEMTKQWLNDYYKANVEELNQMNSDQRLAISKLYLSKGRDQLASDIMKGGGIKNKDIVKETATLEKMFEEFETLFPLSILNSIVDLKGADKDKAPMRTAARDALIPIVALLEILKGSEQHEKLEARYKNCSNAVGFVNSGKVRHS